MTFSCYFSHNWRILCSHTFYILLFSLPQVGPSAPYICMCHQTTCLLSIYIIDNKAFHILTSSIWLLGRHLQICFGCKIHRALEKSLAFCRIGHKYTLISSDEVCISAKPSPASSFLHMGCFRDHASSWQTP